MRISLAEFGRRAARWGAGLLLAPLGLLTSVLFIATARPVPRAFLSIDQLGFRIARDGHYLYEKGKPSFILVTHDWRHNPTLTLIRPDGELLSDEEEVSIRVLETFTLQELSSFRCKLADYGVLELGPDKKHPVSASLHGGKLQIWNLESGKADSVEIEEPWRELGKAVLDWQPEFYFAPNGRHLLIQSYTGVIYYNLFERRTLAVFQAGESSIKTCFFDSRGRPKAVVESSDLEIWDLSSNKLEIKLDESELLKQGFGEREASSGSGRHVAVSFDSAATMFSEKNLLLIHSLEDGRLLRAHTIPCLGDHWPQFSPDGQFLTFDYLQSNQPHALDFLAGWNLELDKWLWRRFPLQPRMALLDMRTGNVVLDLIGDGRCSINNEGTRLVSFTNEGRYEYDIPPRWQYFTSWAWAGLGAWLSLIVIWWRLRKR